MLDMVLWPDLSKCYKMYLPALLKFNAPAHIDCIERMDLANGPMQKWQKVQYYQWLLDAGSIKIIQKSPASLMTYTIILMLKSPSYQFPVGPFNYF